MKRKIEIGETVYILGRYGFGPCDRVHLIEARVAGKRNNRYVAWEKLIDTEWTFTEKHLGKSVFTDRNQAEAEFRKRRREDGERN